MLEFIYCGFFFLVGLCIFSFLNVVIYRVPRKLFWESSRSFCPHCKRQLRAWDLIPVVSWLFLKGRCHYCKKTISVRYPLIELAGGVAALMSLRYFGSWNGWWTELTWQAVDVFLLLSLLMTVAMIDYDTMEIPNGLVLFCLVPSILSIFCFQQISWLSRGLGVFCVSLPMLLLTIAIPGAFGGGDIKFMAIIGLGLGWKLGLTSFFLAILTGGIYGSFLLLTGKKEGKEHFAFGPFLCLGIAAAVFWGESLIRWYFNFLL